MWNKKNEMDNDFSICLLQPVLPTQQMRSPTVNSINLTVEWRSGEKKTLTTIQRMSLLMQTIVYGVQMREKKKCNALIKGAACLWIYLIDRIIKWMQLDR